jgi:DNA-binding CsgD family transcriptional regulator
VLHGREGEQAAIDRLLVGARAGHGGAVIIRGEPGIGKTTLLELGRHRAQDSRMRVLDTVGVEPESALAYATLHRLLHPVIDRVPALPAPQALALGVALGIVRGEVPDRFLVAVAALTLLADVARGGSVLCVVDDLQWADPPSAEVLAFIGRRLASEPIAMLAALRDGGGGDAGTTGITELRLPGLDRSGAERLLGERWPNLAAGVRERVLAACLGNPLALIELPTALASGQLAGRDPLGEPVPLAAKLERAFRQRLRTRAKGTATLLLLAAAESGGTLATIRRAAARLGLDAAAALEAEDLADVVSIEGAAVTFRHPLVRSAVYHGASAVDRRAAHAALAAALGSSDADRRAWHIGQAADGPDEQAAFELERSAGRTLSRSGHAAAATLERAAQLSTNRGDRARRFVMAAEAAWRAGNTAGAAELLDRAEAMGPVATRVRLDLQRLRAFIEFWDGSPPEGARLLATTAIEAAALDPSLAAPLLVGAACATYHIGDRTALVELLAVARRLPRVGEPALDLLLQMLSWAAQAHGEAGTMRRPSSSVDIASIEELADPVLLAYAGELAYGFGDHALGCRLRRRAARRARALGALGTLTWTLENVTLDELWAGNLAMAEAQAQEGRRLALESGQRNSASRHLAHLALVAAARGREDETRLLADQALAEATPRRVAHAVAWAHAALGMLALSLGRADEALDHLAALWTPGGAARHEAVAIAMVPELVEAAVRAGRPECCASQMDAYVTWGAISHARPAEAQTARCRALLARGQDADAHFREALRLHDGAERPLDLARTELAYGEFLRRERRRVEARSHLRAAQSTFERLGLTAWAGRARSEMRASGERARRRNPGTLDQLTPQELQIVRLIAEGTTNRDAAAQLFISPGTVAYHLRNVFAKLGVSSRSELIRLVHGGADRRLAAT